MLLGKFLDFRTFTETLTISHFALAISRCDVHRDRRCRRRPLDHHRRFRLVLAASKAKSRHDGRVSNYNDDKRQTQKGSRKSGSRTHMKSKCLFSLTYATIMMDVKVSCERDRSVTYLLLINSFLCWNSSIIPCFKMRIILSQSQSLHFHPFPSCAWASTHLALWFDTVLILSW